jgi:hypothetical protein
LALALYFAFDRDADVEDGSLFPGGFQNARSGKIMKRILCSNEGLRICSSYGYNPDDFGSHSLRKGAGTFATSGSTIGASIVSLHHRMGWKMGGVMDRYLRFEDAGDQFLGRIVAGLPLDSPDFSLLPPYFEFPETVIDTVSHCFPIVSKLASIHCILQFCLASIVFPSDFLKSHLPENCTVLQNYVFRNPNVVCTLKAKVFLKSSRRITYTKWNSTPCNDFLSSFKFNWANE